MTTFRHTLYSWLPRWAKGYYLFRLLYALVAVFDALQAMLIAAVKYRFPGMYGYDNLRLLAAERKLRQAPRETDPAFAVYLQSMWELGEQWGSFRNLAEQIRRYLMPSTAKIQIVQNNGIRWILEADGSWTEDRTYYTVWNWDGDPTKWSRFWVLISNTTEGLNLTGTTVTFGTVTPAQNGHRLFGSDFVAIGSDPDAPRSLREIVGDAKPPHTFCDTILVLLNETTFWAEMPTISRRYYYWANRSDAARYWQGPSR